MTSATATTSDNRSQVLYLVHRFPYPPDKGDRIRAFHSIRFLSERCDLHVATLADESVSHDHVAELARYCKRLEVVPLRRMARWGRAFCSFAAGGTVTEGAFASRRLRSLIRDWSDELKFDAVLASASSMAPYLRMAELHTARKVVDLVDVDSEKWLQYADSSRWPKSWLYRLEGRRLRRLERSLLGFADAITLVSQAEADLYRNVCGDGPVHAITNGVDLEYFAPPANPPAPEEACVFVGAMDYRPNIDGVLWFAKHVWPQVRARCPKATFYIVGRRPAPAIQRLAQVPGVIVTGAVPDVRPYLNRAAVVVAPLLIARGIQNKILEAMAACRPVVASPEAIVGLPAHPREHLIEAASIEEWGSAVCRLLKDPCLQRRFGRAARKYAENQHAWERCLSAYVDVLKTTQRRAADTATWREPGSWLAHIGATMQRTSG